VAALLSASAAAAWKVAIETVVHVCVLLHLCSCEDKFVRERGVARLWEIARLGFLLPRN